MNNVSDNQGRRSLLASIGAAGSILAASSCCLPLLPFAFAAGAAGSSLLLDALRPYLLIVSVLCVAFGFYQAWRAQQCKHPTSVLTRVLLWVSAAIILVSIVFPQAWANFLAGGSGNTAPNGQQPLSFLTPANFSTLKNDFNRAQDRVRIILTLSPT